LVHRLSDLYDQESLHGAAAADHRWEHEDVPEAVQRRLDLNPQTIRQRREVVEHPFGMIALRMSATHLLPKTLPKVAGAMALHVLAYNLTLVLNILGIQPSWWRSGRRGGALSASSTLQASDTPPAGVGSLVPSTISQFALTDDGEGLWSVEHPNPTSAKAF
jgi:transposase